MVTEIFRGEHCLTVWNRTPDTMKGQTPIAGAIVIWRKIGTAQGHCGIVEGLEASGKYLRTIEGNTGVLGARESRDGGDGVCRKVRPLRGFGEMTTVGFLYPFAPGPIRLRARMPPTDKAPPTV